MGKEFINSLKTIRDNGKFFQKFGWQIIEHGYSLYIYKPHVTASDALIVDCSLKIDLDLHMTTFKGVKKLMETKANALTFDLILSYLKSLEKESVVDPVVVVIDADVQGQSSSHVPTAIPIKVPDISTVVPKPESKKFARCDECNRTFNSLQGYRAHKIIKHGPNYRCNICQNIFESVGALQRHEFTCRKKRLALAQTQVGSSGYLEVVRRPLQSQELYKCWLCEKQFASQIHLVEHHMFHSQEIHGAVTRFRGFSQFSFGSSNQYMR